MTDGRVQGGFIERVTDGATEFVGAVTARLSNPLIWAFIISWAVCNWRLVLTLLGEGEFQTKIYYIDDVLYKGWDWATLGIAAPLGLAITYLLLGPFVAREVLAYEKRQDVITRNRLLAASEVAVLTEAEGARLREELAQLRREHAEEVGRLRAQHDQAWSSNKSIREFAVNSIQARAAAARELAHYMAQHWPEADETIPDPERVTVTCAPESNMPPATSKFLRNVGLKRSVFLALELAVQFGQTSVAEVSNALRIPPSQAEEHLVIALGLGLLACSWASGEAPVFSAMKRGKEVFELAKPRLNDVGAVA